MKDNSPSFFESLGYFVAARALAIVFFFCTGVLALVLFYISENLDSVGLRIVASLIFLVGLFGCYPVSKQIVGRMIGNPPMSFSLAARHTFHHYLLCLAFIPLVGPLVQRMIDRKRNRNPFFPDEE